MTPRHSAQEDIDGTGPFVEPQEAEEDRRHWIEAAASAYEPAWSGDDQRELDAGRPELFVRTPFAARMLGLLAHAKKQRSWHVPNAQTRSGKSATIREFLRAFTGTKDAETGATRLPVLAVRAPAASPPDAVPASRARESRADGRLHDAVGVAGSGLPRDLGKKLARQFGAEPGMGWDDLKPWLVEQFYECEVELLIIDDAPELTAYQLAYLKELTDDLEGPPYYRRIGLCLVCARLGSVVPLQRLINADVALWAQFKGRLDGVHPFPSIANHDAAEVQVIVAGLDKVYARELGGRKLEPYSKSIHAYLTHRVFDPDRSGLVTMGNLVKLVQQCMATVNVDPAAPTDRVLHAAATLLRSNHGAETLLQGQPLVDLSNLGRAG